jgi:hypothetical protein
MQRKQANDLLERKKAAIASGFSEARWTVQTWSGALAGSAIWRAESAADIISNQLESSRLTIQWSLDRLARARQSWDAAEVILASQELRANREQQQNQKIQLLQAKRQGTSDVLSVLTWKENEEDIINVAEQFGVDESLVETLSNQVKLWLVSKDNQAAVKEQENVLDFVQTLATKDLLADITSDQAKDFDLKAWLPLWTTASLVLTAQANRKLDKADKALANQKTAQEINNLKSQISTRAWDLAVKEFEAWLTNAPPSTSNVQTTLQVWDMAKFKWRTNEDWSVITRPTVEWSESSEIWDWNIVLW